MSLPASRCICRILMAVAAVMLADPAAAGGQFTSRLSQIGVIPAINIVWIKTTGTVTGQASCASAGYFATPINTDAGRAVYRTLLAAQVQGFPSPSGARGSARSRVGARTFNTSGTTRRQIDLSRGNGRCGCPRSSEKTMTTLLRKVLNRCLMALAIGLTPSLVHCGTLTGTIASMFYWQSTPSIVFIIINGTAAGGPACAASYASRMVLDITTAVGKAAYNRLVLHKVLTPDASVTLGGTGNCALYGDTETVSHVTL